MFLRYLPANEENLCHKFCRNFPEFDTKMMMSMEKMGRNADLQIINGRIDHDFAILMTGHHQSAIEMSKWNWTTEPMQR